jgi:hypothetical protein
MRRAVAAKTILALLLAFVLAPFQHVHPDHHDHAHTGEIHAHFFPVQIHAEHKSSAGIKIAADDDDDDHAHARSIDTYTLILPGGVPSFFPSPAPVLPAVQTSRLNRIEFVEARANSPPSLRQSPPRAPPLF